MSALRIAALILAAVVCVGFAHRGQDGTEDTAQEIRFVTVDVLVDPAGSTLAAYQVRVEDAAGHAKLVGVEGGEDRSFTAPPHHDPRALQGGAVILAAFDETDAGPRGETRVARLSFAVEGGGLPEFIATAEVVASPDGPIEGATVRLLR